MRWIYSDGRGNLNEYTAWNVSNDQAKLWGVYKVFTSDQLNYNNIGKYKPIYSTNQIMTLRKVMPW